MLLYGAAPPAGEPTLELVRRELPLDGAEATVRTRELLEATLPRWGFSDLADVASQCVSEVLASLDHAAADAVVLHLLRRPQQLDVELHYTGLDHRLHELLADDARRARAIALVDELASLWGVRPLLEGEVVWFEFRRDRPSVPLE